MSLDIAIGIIGYGINAFAFLMLFLLLLISWGGGRRGALLLISVVISLGWGVTAAATAATDWGWISTTYQVLESLRYLAWYLFIYHLLQTDPESSLRDAFSRGWGPYLIAVPLIVLAADLLPEHYWYTWFGDELDLRLFGHLALALIGLVLIEQLFRDTQPEQRWGIKFLCIGVGGLFAYDFFMYSDALLFRRIDEDLWAARGIVDTLAIPLIGISAGRNPNWSVQVFISQRMAVHSVSLVSAGIYLLFMSAAGYFIRAYGGSWGGAVQIAFLFGAGLVLLMLLFSGQLRAQVKVFLSKHFFTYQYDYREEWLRIVGELSTAGTGFELRQKAIRVIAEILESPGGTLWFRDPEGDDFALAAVWNAPLNDQKSLPPRSSIVRFLEHTQWVVDIKEYWEDPSAYNDLELPGWIAQSQQQGYIVPLFHTGRLNGFVTLLRSKAYRPLNWEDHDLLKNAGSQVAGYLALQDITERLVEARQFEAFNRLSAYVVHDLKNIVYQLTLVSSNAKRHRHNPAFVDDALATVENATNKMKRMLQQLRKGQVAGELTDRSRIELAPLLERVVKARAQLNPVPELIVDAPSITLRVEPDRLAAVIEHLVQNAQEATLDSGWVRLRAARNEEEAIIEIADNGHGMDAEFIRDRLFRPFDTTKGNAGMGIGVYESREFILGLGGRIDVASQPGEGTTFTLHLPLAPQLETPPVTSAPASELMHGE